MNTKMMKTTGGTSKKLVLAVERVRTLKVKTGLRAGFSGTGNEVCDATQQGRPLPHIGGV